MAATSATGFSDEARERKKQEKEIAESPSHSAATESRFPLDIRLRNAGFQIVSRPSTGSPVWARHGVELLERDALALCGIHRS